MSQKIGRGRLVRHLKHTKKDQRSYYGTLPSPQGLNLNRS